MRTSSETIASIRPLTLYHDGKIGGLRGSKGFICALPVTAVPKRRVLKSANADMAILFVVSPGRDWVNVCAYDSLIGPDDLTDRVVTLSGCGPSAPPRNAVESVGMLDLVIERIRTRHRYGQHGGQRACKPHGSDG